MLRDADAGADTVIVGADALGGPAVHADFRTFLGEFANVSRVPQGGLLAAACGIGACAPKYSIRCDRICAVRCEFAAV